MITITVFGGDPEENWKLVKNIELIKGPKLYPDEYYVECDSMYLLHWASCNG
jgi:hypothetical protein